MNHASQKLKVLGCIVAVPPDVILCDLGVESKKAIHASGPGEDVCSMAQLRSFNHNRFLNVENVFGSKQIDPARSAGELVIEKQIIIRAPADLSDIEGPVAREVPNTFAAARLARQRNVPGAGESDLEPVSTGRSDDRPLWQIPLVVENRLAI